MVVLIAHGVTVPRDTPRFRRTATRMSVSVGVAAVVAATVVPVSSASEPPPPDKTALVLGGTTIPTPDQAYLDAVRDLFVEPTHPGQHIDYVAVTTPEEGWPLTGVVRLILLVTGPPSLVGFDGPVWPDEPWWKLSGLFDLTYDQSNQAGDKTSTAKADDIRSRVR